MQLLRMLIPVPVRPADFIILAVGVVVSVLRPAVFVSPAEHGYALRQKKRSQKVALLSPAKGVYLLIFRRPFSAAVPRSVVVVAVLIVLAVGVIVLVVVGNQIR